MNERGLRIIIEGTDATGKSTAANGVAEKLRGMGHDVIRVDEPDSAMDSEGNVLVPISSELRRIVKDGSLARSAFTNLLLFSASRRENWVQQIKPALENGTFVVQARSDESTKVYQGFVENVDLDLIRHLTLLSTDEEYMNPDLRVILDLDDEAERSRRLANRGPLDRPDTFESRGDAFQRAVIDGYRRLAEEEAIPIISAEGTPEEVLDRIWHRVEPLL